MAGATRRVSWGLFWLLFAAGWGLFAYLAATNGRMATPVSPGGILDHQVAGTAAQANAIQQAWADKGELGFARTSMSVDLVFIAVLTAAGVYGGLAIARVAKGPVLRALGNIAALLFVAYAVADYVETVCQLMEAINGGDDQLARTAAIANKPKIYAFLAGHLALFAGLIGVFLRRGSAA
jgi:hypothetical protein